MEQDFSLSIRMIIKMYSVFQINKFQKKIIFWIILVWGVQIYPSNEIKDELKENLLKSGKSRIESISSIKVLNREDLISFIPEILHNSESEKELLTAIILLYKSYGVDLDKVHPKWIEDFEWILDHSREELHFIEIFNFIEQKKERRLLYPITAFLKYPSYEIRLTAYKALGALGDDRAIPFLFELGNSERGIFRKYYLESLPFFKDDRILSLLPKLLADPSPAIRSECISAIEKLFLKEKFYILSGLAGSDPNYEVRKHAVVSLKNIYHKNKTYIFQKTIFDDNPEVRGVSLEAIYSIRDPSYSRFISNAMEKEQFLNLKLAMIETLIVLGNHGGGGGLIHFLKDDKSVDVRIRSAQAIGILNLTSASSILLTTLKYEDQSPVKLEMIRSLGLLKEKNAVTYLIDTLKKIDTTFDIRKETILSLEKIDDSTVMPFFFDQIEIEENQEIKSILKKTLREMLYKYHGKIKK